MSIYHVNPPSYGRIRFYEANRCFNTETLRQFNQGKILCGEIVSFDCGLFKMYEIQSLGQSLREMTQQIVAVIVRPSMEPDITLEDNGFTFCGYDLIDEFSSISAVTNCGGSFESIDYANLSEFGLIRNYKEAVLTQLALVEEAPNDEHADCEIVEIWRKLV